MQPRSDQDRSHVQNQDRADVGYLGSTWDRDDVVCLDGRDWAEIVWLSVMD